MTKFEEIYELATAIMESEEIFQAPLYKKYSILYKFLTFAIAEFNTRCYRDLTTIQPFSYRSYKLVGDGLEVEYGLTSPLTTLTKIYIERESGKNTNTFLPVDSSEYTVDTLKNSIVFSVAPKEGTRINVYTYEIGYFYDDLDFEEKSILANGMVIAFYQNELNRTTVMNQQVYGVGAKMYSQAEHIKRLGDLLKSTRYEWTAAINAYTYSKNPDLVLDKSRTQVERKKDY